jgi:hypothetical protein
MNKLDIFHYFLAIGIDPNAVCEDWSCLHLAAFLGMKDYVEILLFFKADAAKQDRFGVLFQFT